MGGFQVRPEELNGAGQCARAIAARIPDETGRLTPAGTADRLSGWRTAAALRACGDAWRALLTSLAGELDAQGQRLTTTARQYRDGETTAAGALLEPPPLPGQRHSAADPFGSRSASR